MKQRTNQTQSARVEKGSQPLQRDHAQLIAAIARLAGHPDCSPHLANTLNTLSLEIHNELLALAEQHSSLSQAQRDSQVFPLLLQQAFA